ncbi:hypothetical protein EVAR_45869_1 [Eumeta japonica]|uniref:Uncharacterized protein n=1 Tax=Eumeta variegata TaxID=151549 RepID=A0A4C1WNX8_EUMVA|nr:hypothetical protein EVAR_45869_1 [Eumeta japonica]
MFPGYVAALVARLVSSPRHVLRGLKSKPLSLILMDTKKDCREDESAVYLIRNDVYMLRVRPPTRRAEKTKFTLRRIHKNIFRRRSYPYRGGHVHNILAGVRSDRGDDAFRAPHAESPTFDCDLDPTLVFDINSGSTFNSDLGSVLDSVPSSAFNSDSAPSQFRFGRNRGK